MKKILLPAIAVIASQGLFAQIENGSFDAWIEQQLFEHPQMGIETMSSNYETFFHDGSTNVNAVSGPDGNVLRIQTAGAQGQTIPAFFITGNVPEQEGEGLIFGGGVPLTDPDITGVSFSIRHKIIEGSPGFVLVQFKADGVPVGEGNMGPGTTMLPLVGMTEWHDVNITFENGFETTPDACVFAVASADLLGGDQVFPPGSYVEVDNLEFIRTGDIQEIHQGGEVQTFPGGDFENWADVPSIHTPEGVLVEANPTEAKFERTEDANSGMYALALETMGGEDWANPTKAVFAGGEIGNSIPVIELDESHSAVSFAYKFEAEDDKAGAVFRFFTQTSEGFFVQVSEKELILEPVDEYTDVEYNFLETSEAPTLIDTRGSISEATHMTIEFKSGTTSEDNSPQAGSVLKIDDVALSGALRTLSLNIKTPEVTAHPNPATERIQFTFQGPRFGSFIVYNSAGIQVDQQEFSNTSQFVYNLRHLRSGPYVFRFQHNEGVDAVRVIKW